MSLGWVLGWVLGWGWVWGWGLERLDIPNCKDRTHKICSFGLDLQHCTPCLLLRSMLHHRKRPVTPVNCKYRERGLERDWDWDWGWGWELGREMDKLNNWKSHKTCNFALARLHCNLAYFQSNRTRHRMFAGCQQNYRCNQRLKGKLLGKDK